MAEVFISYRHVDPDQRLAAELSTYLTQKTVSHFVDKEIRIGEEWVEVIERELKAAKSLIVLLSAHSILSDMVRQEIKLAHQWKKQIFPVRVDYEGALPYDLGAYLDPIQYKLWRTGEPFAPICGAILESIRTGSVRSDLEPAPEALRRLAEVTGLSGAPLPKADPRLETGALQLNSPFYVRRCADENVERLVTQSGDTILIRGPRQVGKTSLAARACAAAERSGQRAYYIDLQLPDESRLRDFGTLVKYLAARLSKGFRTTIQPKDVWDDMLGDADSLTEFVERAVLSDVQSSALVCLDEIDTIFRYAHRDSFFGMLRGWHNRRATHPIWNRLNLLIAHSTEPALFIRDLNQSPFNVGTVVRLGNFDRDEVLWLNRRHDSPLTDAEGVECFLRLVSGHPYLVRQGLYAMATGRFGIEHLEKVASDDTGPFGDHLRRLLWDLRDNERLRKALKRVLTGRGCEDEDDFQRLRSAGLITGESRQTAMPRCQLYASYMEKHL